MEESGLRCTFPLPKLTEQNKADLTACAENILLAREAHFPATIADIYDPETMPENLTPRRPLSPMRSTTPSRQSPPVC
jgi:hypothetical protein